MYKEFALYNSCDINVPLLGQLYLKVDFYRVLVTATCLICAWFRVNKQTIDHRKKDFVNYYTV